MREDFLCGCGRSLVYDSYIYRCSFCMLKVSERDISCPHCQSPAFPYRFDLPVKWNCADKNHQLACSNSDCPAYRIKKSRGNILLLYGNLAVFKLYKTGGYAVLHHNTSHAYSTPNINQSRVGTFFKNIMDKKLEALYDFNYREQR